MENNPKPKRPIWKRWWFIMLVGFVALFVIAGSGAPPEQATNPPPATQSPTTGTPAAPPPPAAPAAPAAPRTISVSMTLTNGHYTAGIDFPAGRYNIEAVKGGGNVSSTNAFSGGINAIMGVAGQGDMFQQKYSNINLPKGTVLSISRVAVTISSDAASASALEPRNQPIRDSVTLGNGHFVAGKDFPAGTYDISAVSGSGNVSSSNILSGGINAMMGVAGQGDLFEQLYKNIALTKDVTLSISNVRVKLTPSK